MKESVIRNLLRGSDESEVIRVKDQLEENRIIWNSICKRLQGNHELGGARISQISGISYQGRYKHEETRTNFVGSVFYLVFDVKGRPYRKATPIDSVVDLAKTESFDPL